jgi:tRNA(Ile)-lysidine synthase
VASTLAQRVLAYIRKHRLISAGDRVGIAVSGGADSVALMRVLLELRGELGIVLSVVHFNHKIRAAAADADERFVRDLAMLHGLELHTSSGDTPAFARERKLSIETAARQLRYAYFESLMKNGMVARIATAHTLDDQAETVLLRIVRGTGITGLRGIARTLNYADQDGEPWGIIVRPLLGCRRAEIESYLRSLNQQWCEDATNADVTFTRNRVRHSLLPLLEREFNPAVKERLSELADSAASDDEFCESHALAEGIGSIVSWPRGFHEAEHSRLASARARDIRLGVPEHERVDLDTWSRLPLAAKRRLVRHLVFNASAGNLPDFQHVERVIDLANTSDPNSRVDLPGGVRAYKKTEYDDHGQVAGKYVVFAKEPQNMPGDYSYTLPVSGQVVVRELNCTICARLVQPDNADRLEAEKVSGEPTKARYNRDQLLNPDKLPSELTIRNWRPGDRFWPAHTATPHKIKELLQKKHISGQQRESWPVALNGDEIVWVKGFAVARQYRAAENGPALLIEVHEIGDADAVNR